MAYLGKYIRQILSRQERVILPGFGSLVIRKGGGISGSGGRIDPPGTVISFDGEHPKDDGKLAGEYASGENIDSEEARQQVLELVDAIKFKLDKGEKYHLDLVGIFSRDNDNRIHFEKDPNWILDPDLFGLPSLDLLELEEEQGDLEEVKSEGVSDPLSVSVAQKVPEQEKIIPIDKDPVPMKKKMANRAPVNKWKIIWIIVGSLIVVLIAILLIPSGSDYGIEFSRDGIVMKDNSVNEKIPDGEMTNELVTDDLESGEANAGQKEGEHQGGQNLEDQANTIADMPVETSNNFFIIAGSFQNLPNATELMESLKAEGFPAEIIITESRLYRVAVQSYPDKQKALDDLSRIKASPGLGSCWVWSR